MSEEQFVQNNDLGGVLRQISGQLRSSLANINIALERLAPLELRDGDGRMDMNAALLMQSYFRIMRLANNLEDAAGLNGPLPVSLKNDDIVGLCRRLAEEAKVPAELLDLELAFRSSKGSCFLAMDADRLERMILNLLSNAFKFTPAGGRVSFEVKVEKEQVVLLVSDTGCGISPELQDTIYDRFRHTQQLDPPPHGLGLGLTICRQAAEAHGGRLLVLPKKEGGTTATVSIPRRKVEQNTLDSLLILPKGGFNRTLVELSDALPREAFTARYMD